MLLPTKFHTLMPQDGGLGPVKRDPAPLPVAHVHNWRDSTASPWHIVCRCGVSMLREHAPVPAPVKPAVIEDGDALDWYGLDWTPHDGKTCPVADDANIFVRMADGSEYTDEIACAWEWSNDHCLMEEGRITHWRYAVVPVKPQPDADGWIEHTGDVAPVPAGTRIDIKASIFPDPLMGYTTKGSKALWGNVTHWRLAK